MQANIKARLIIMIGLVFSLTAAFSFAADNTLTAQEQTQGWVLLFDGKTLDGWDSAAPVASGTGTGRRKTNQGKAPAQPGAAPAVGSNPKPCPASTSDTPPGASHWEVANGMLTPCGDPAGYLSTNESYKDFVLDVDFRTGENTNSGVFVRSPVGIQGYEVQIWKAQPAGYNTGSIVGTAKTDAEYKFRPDQWNHYEITADGAHLIVVLNGTKTLDVHDSKFSDGHIRLQYQKYPIEFKNIKIKLLTH
jgi:Domain of Unknown Function (DUF1080)